MKRGAAMIELAVSMPLILTIVLATMEITSITYARQMLESTAQECGRVAAKRNATDSDVRDRLADITAQLGLQAAQVTTEPTSIEDLEPGTRIHVIVQADTPSNSFVSGNLYGDDGILADIWIIKEL